MGNICNVWKADFQVQEKSRKKFTASHAESIKGGV
jgi:hypothetical protein